MVKFINVQMCQFYLKNRLPERVACLIIFLITVIGLSLLKLNSGMPSAKTVDDAFLTLPKPELAMAKRLRSLIQECLPKAKEEPKYGLGVPFYRHHRMICFIWPSSFYWGPKKKESSGKPSMVTLGFCQGNLMSNEEGVLLAEGRK
jgi:hypothetical protein